MDEGGVPNAFFEFPKNSSSLDMFVVYVTHHEQRSLDFQDRGLWSMLVSEQIWPHMMRHSYILVLTFTTSTWSHKKQAIKIGPGSSERSLSHAIHGNDLLSTPRGCVLT